MKKNQQQVEAHKNSPWGVLIVVLLIAVLVFMAPSSYGDFGFTPPATLSSNADTDSASDYHPQVTTDGSGNCVAVWESYEDLGGTAGTDWDILVSCSADNGITWSAVATLSTNADADLGDDRQPQVTTDGSGNWVATWYSDENLGGTAGADSDIFVSRSTDNGATWSAVATLNTNADTDLGHDSRSHVATDRSGNWVAVWESEDIEKLYTQLYHHFDLDDRHRTIARKLSFISDNTSFLYEFLSNRKSHQLEWTIIILIAFEILLFIVFELLLK